MKSLSESQQNFLGLVGSLSYLTHRELAELNWPNMAPASAIVTAQTAGKKLAERGLVLVRDLPCDQLQRAYVLTTKGADFLNLDCMEQWLETESTMLWFADGYNLSLRDYVARRPLTALLHAMAAGTGLRPVGQRAVARGFLGLTQYKNFDALLLNDGGGVEFGVYLAHSSTKTATDYIRKLARTSDVPFLVAAAQPSVLAALVRWRATGHPATAAHVVSRLPAGVVA